METSNLEPAQVRAARALLDWSQERLAEAAGVSVPTVKRFEAGSGPASATAESVVKIRGALEAAQIEFLSGISDTASGYGVRLKADSEAYRLRLIRDLMREQSALFKTTLQSGVRVGEMEDIIGRMERLAELLDGDIRSHISQRT